MNRSRCNRFLKGVLACPTAPFHEYHVRNYIREVLAGFPHVSVEEDGFGNLLATYRRGRRRARYVFGAHMDHPGWVKQVGEGAEKEREHKGLEFLGGVPAAYLANPVLEEFGDFAMWDLPALEVRDGLIHSRACDDLVNCATILAVFDHFERRGVETSVHAVFTRAEEVGFVGAVNLARRWPYPAGVVFVSLETSAPVPGVEIGGGPVLRVGDRLSIFDHNATGHFAKVAAEAGIKVQRCLLDRGACEASAIQAYGIPAAGISIALGNYHNCGTGTKIEAEYVSMSDYLAMVALVAAIIETPPAGKDGGLRQRLEKRARSFRPYGRATASFFQRED